MSEDQESLIERARAGDDAAIATLCRRHEAAIRQRLYQRLPQRLRRRISVSDVAQETLVTAVQRLSEGAWTHEGAFRAWLLKIADFKVKEAIRFHLGTAKRAVGAERSHPHRPRTAAFEGREPSPSEGAMVEESKQQVDAGLAGLRSDYRLVIELVHRHGCSMAEAGERLGRSADAARKLYARAISALSKHLNAGEEEEDDNGPV